MNELLAKLGLASDASEASAVNKVVELLNRATTADALTKKVETLESELATQKMATLKNRADAFCDANETKIKNRAAVHAQFLRDPDGTEALFESIEMPAGKPPVSLNNRQNKQPGKVGSPETTQSNAQKLESEVQTYRLNNRCSYSMAHDAVSAAHPELLQDDAAADD